MMWLYLVAAEFELKAMERTSARTTQTIFPAVLAALLLCAVATGRANAQTAPLQTAPAQGSTGSTAAPPSHPTGAPVVTYENGQLTIVAENATLADIMSELRKAMGTEVELPAGSSGERIWAHLGPASAHKVLSDLLANTDLNYIIQGSRTDAGAIQTVTLSVRLPDAGTGKGGPVETAANRRGARVAPQPAPEPEPGPEPVPQETAAASVAPSTPAASQGTDSAAPAAAASTASADASSSAALAPPDASTPSTPTSASMSPTGAPNIYPQTPQPSAGSFNAHPSLPASMSTDQMVQQLSNMYQQRRQMQQSQAGSPN